jgi:hypothetical protein
MHTCEAFQMERASRSDFMEAPGMWYNVPVVVENVVDASQVLEQLQQRAMTVHKHQQGKTTYRRMPWTRAVETMKQDSCHASPMSAE